jgi:hypothetical protein
MQAFGCKALRAALGMLALGCMLAAGPAAGAGWAFVNSLDPFRLDENGLGEFLPGGKSAPALVAYDNSGFIATFLNTRSSTDVRAFAHYFSSSGFPIQSPKQMGAASGPTGGALAASGSPISFTDGAGLVLFSADRRNAAASAKKDIFAQRMNVQRDEEGLPVGVNQTFAGTQTRIVATRLSNGNVIAAYQSHATAASSFDINGRVVDKSGIGVFAGKVLTAPNAGAQTPIAIAPLLNGASVLSYVVRTNTVSGVRQDARVQRLSATGARLGNSVLLKSTTGADNNFGAAGVAALSGGRFMTAWLRAGTNGTAQLRARIFNANGTSGAPFTIGTTRISPTLFGAPKIVARTDGNVVVVTDGRSVSGVSQINGWLLSPTNQLLLGPSVLVSSAGFVLTSTSLIQMLGNKHVVAWTRGTSPQTSQARAQIFSANQCSRC